MPKRTFQYSFDTTATHSYPASTNFLFIATAPLIALRPGDKVRAQHLEGVATEGSRKVQLFGSFVCGLAFFDSSGTLIDGLDLAAINVNTPDATIVPIDRMIVTAEDPHFLEMASMNFSGPNFPTQAALYAAVQAKNSDGGAAHSVSLQVVGVLEVETE